VWDVKILAFPKTLKILNKGMKMIFESANKPSLREYPFENKGIDPGLFVAVISSHDVSFDLFSVYHKGKVDMRILIAEDDSVSRQQMQKFLAKFGHIVLSAEDVLQAWEYFKDLFQEVWHIVRKGDQSFYEAEKEALHIDHAQIGAYMAENSNFPENL